MDTSIVRAVLYMQRMQQSIVRERSGALVLYIILIALSCARLPIEPARVYLVGFSCPFLGLVLTPGLRAGSRFINCEAQLLSFTFCGRFWRPLCGLQIGVGIGTGRL